MKNRLYDGFVFLWFSVFSLYVILQRSCPRNFDDEYGMMGAMAVFAGYSWNTPADLPFYGFLLALFTFPLYWFDLAPDVLYRSVLCVNAFFLAASAVLGLKIIRLLCEKDSEWWRVTAVIAGFSYPAALHYSVLAKGETALLFCFFFIAFHFTVLFITNEARIVNAILLGIGIGAAQYSHPRGVAFVIAALIVIAYALRIRSISWKLFTVTALSTSLTVLSLASVKSYLLTVFNTHQHNSSSLVSFVGSKFSVFSGERLIPFFQVVFGQLTYLFSTSFGLIVSGLAILLFVFWRTILDCETFLPSDSVGSITKGRGLLSGFVVLSFVIMFAASVFQMAGAVRGDHFFYGRYNEVMVPALVIAAIIFLSRGSRTQVWGWITGGFVVALLSLMLINYYPEDIFQRRTNFSSITSWFVYAKRSWEINPDAIFSGTVAAISVLAATLLLSRKVFVVTLILFFTSAVLYNFETQHKRGDRDWNEFNKLAVQLGHEMAGLKLQVRASESLARIKGEALQIAFPKAHVDFQNNLADDVTGVLDYHGDYCNEKNTVAYMRYASFCVVDEKVVKQLTNITVPLDITPQQPRPETAPSIKVDGKLRSTGIMMGRLERVCALIANQYYTAWFRYFLPSITVRISQLGLSWENRSKLGVFITDSSGQWREQWRMQLDNRWMEENGSMHAIVSVPVKSTLPAGEYRLNIALIDGQGWDWREVEKIRLIVE